MKSGLKFRVLNWLTRGYLRNYLAVGVRLPIINAMKYCEHHPDVAVCELEKAKRTVEEIFKW